MLGMYASGVFGNYGNGIGLWEKGSMGIRCVAGLGNWFFWVSVYCCSKGKKGHLSFGSLLKESMVYCCMC